MSGLLLLQVLDAGLEVPAEVVPAAELLLTHLHAAKAMSPPSGSSTAHGDDKSERDQQEHF